MLAQMVTLGSKPARFNIEAVAPLAITVVLISVEEVRSMRIRIEELSTSENVA
jgi:hypothetical protein